MKNLTTISPRLSGVIAALFILCYAQSLFAQGGQPKTTGQVYVTAIVDPGSGWVQVKRWPGRNIDGTLSYYQKSFVSFSVNNKVYTNNDVGLPSPLPANTVILKDGVLTVRKGVTKGTDTIVCTWPNKDGIDLIQEVYPVLFEKSEQIVFRWKVFNKTPSPAIIAVQYLLDIQVGDQTYTNDGAPLLTRYGYRPFWDQFTPSQGSGIPWFYIAFQYPLPHSPTFDPGLSGQGYTDNTVANLGLTLPVRQTIGNWPDLIQYRWGPPAPLPGGQYTDCATLLEFNAAASLPNKESFVAATSYGTGEFATCKGQLFGVLFYPLRVKWQAPNLVPDPFLVDFFAFNPSPTNGAPNTTLSLTVGPYLTITAPTNPPILNGGKSQTQSVQTAGLIPPLGVATASWTVKPEKVTQCSTDLYSSLKFVGISPGVGYPVFVNESNGSDTCEHPIIIECANQDLRPPIIDAFVDIDTFTRKFDVHDDRPTTDKGIKSITWAPHVGTDSTKFTISYAPAITPCDTKKHTITVHQIDSTIAGCFDFTFEDCAGNKSDTTMCFIARIPPATPDLLPPVITIIDRIGRFDSTTAICNSRLDSLLATDVRQYDRGLLNINVISSTNMNLRSLPFAPGTPSHLFAVTVVDSMLNGTITLRICDRDSNCVDTTLTYCTIADTIKPRVQIVPDGIYRGRWMVRVSEDLPWDRLIDTIAVVSPVNISFPFGAAPTRAVTRGKDYYEFPVVALDTTKPSSFCIDATDLAGNLSSRVCVSQGIDSDKYAPNINYVPPANTNPIRITVTVDDLHKDANGDSIVWDKGVDSVWFTNVIGIKTPGPLSFGNCPMVAPTFDLSVIDTLAVTPSACVTIWARDCAGNVAVPVTWCYPYKQDTLPPTIVGTHIGRGQVDFVVTDSALYDRGNDLIELVNEVNFTPPISVNGARAPIVPDLLVTRNLSTSSKGTLRTIDYWGAQTNSDLSKHTASIDFGIYVQNMAMTKGILLQKSGDFVIPVFLTQTDTFALNSKGIREFEFKFAINGDAQSIAFKGATSAGTLSNGWNITATPSGNQLTIRGTAPGSSVLADPLGDYKTPLVLLEFTATKDEIIRDITLDIEAVNGDYVIYNGNRDTVLYGKNAQVSLPAPYGTLSGSHIVIIGTCTPSLSADNPNPTSITLAQNRPNPFNANTMLRYTLNQEGPVHLAVYDMLGNEVQLLFDGVQKQGTYDIKFDGTPFPEGSYLVRLKAGNTVKQKNIMLQK